jgi:hypothetical protein
MRRPSKTNLLDKHRTYQQAGDRSDTALLPEELVEKKKTTKLEFGEVADNEEKSLLY